MDVKNSSLTDSKDPFPAKAIYSAAALALLVLIFAGQVVWQREYWGAAISQGTLFPKMQRQTFIGHRESGNDSHTPLPIPGSQESLFISRPPGPASVTPPVASPEKEDSP